MLLSLAWRNLARNRRRTFMTGFAVATAVILLGWLVGFTHGGYDQMVDQATGIRVGHIQVMPEGYLDQPSPKRVVPGAEDLARRIAAIDGVKAVSPRVLAEGLLGRDSERVPVELVGVEPEAERAATVVHVGVIRGERATRWCRREMADALSVLGGDEELFGHWCEAAGRGEFLSRDRPRDIVLGTGVAKRLVVSVGDEITVQVVRAVGHQGEGGEEAGARMQRRLVVAGIVAAGRPEIDERGAYLHASTLADMLGTDGPNEIVVVLDSIRSLEEVRGEVSAIVDHADGIVVHSWAERDPTLASIIEMMKSSRAIFFAILAFLVVLSVANATLMSVLERRREFGVMLALGVRPSTLMGMIMTEVALLGAVAVAIGAAVAAGIEIFGRLHGWPVEWIGMNYEARDAMTLSDLHGSTFHANMPTAGALLIVFGVYAMFLLTGLWSAFQARRIDAAEALKGK